MTNNRGINLAITSKPMEDHREAVQVYDMSRMRSTPVPNVVLEAALRLPETQTRLLLLITRDTLGYTAGPGRRRASVRMSHAQIGKRIGRSSTAITQAIEGLVALKLLEATDGVGRQLATAQERRLLRAALWYRLPHVTVEG